MDPSPTGVSKMGWSLLERLEDKIAVNDRLKLLTSPW